MKTISDAARALRQPDAAQKFAGVGEEVALCPELLQAVLQIVCSPTPAYQQLLQVLSIGVCVGMEMERP